MNSPKIKSFREITAVVKKLKKSGKRIVFTNGCFDILHIGHVKLLDRAKSFGDVLIVGLNSDSSVRKIKGPGRPVNREDDRAGVLAALSAVDFVVKFFQPTPHELIKNIMPDVLVKGSDWVGGKIVGREFAGIVRRVQLKKGYSTTGTIEKINKL